MAEIEKNRSGNTDSLELDVPDSNIETSRDDDIYLTVYDEYGHQRKVKVVFSVVDKKNSASYIFVEQGEDEVIALATKIDENGNPTQDELEEVGPDSPYLSAVQEYLEAYNSGDLVRGDEDEKGQKA